MPELRGNPEGHGWAALLATGPFGEDWRYLRRLLITIAAIGLAYFLWRISEVLLLVFAAVLIAVLLRAFADLIARYSPIPARWSLTPAILIVAGLVIGFLFLFGSQIGGQLSTVAEKLPGAINAIGDKFGVANASGEAEKLIGSVSGASALSRAAGVGYTVLGAVGDVALVIVAAIYFAADPRLYRRGTAKLLPPSQHERVLDAMDVTGNALKLWFGGQLVSMVLVAVVSGLAYWWIGLPSPLALAVIAGITNFVPYLGPLFGAVPALIFAFAIDLEAVLWTAGAVIAIQQLEGNLITPFIQMRTAAIPAVLILFSIVIFGLIFGLLGIFLAVPLAVCITVLVKKLWVRQTLGEATSIPGEEPEIRRERV